MTPNPIKAPVIALCIIPLLLHLYLKVAYVLKKSNILKITQMNTFTYIYLHLNTKLISEIYINYI